MNVRVLSDRAVAALATALLLLSLAGCSPRQMIIGNVADQLAAQGQAAESDLELTREASAFYLKLSEAVLRQQPAHKPLAEAVAAGFTQYAYAFVAFEADQIEDKDVKTAERLRQRAAKLYRRARDHALLALETGTPGFRQQLAAPQAAAWPQLHTDQLGLAYWAAAAWGGYISLSKDDPDAVADLVLAVRLAQLAGEIDPDYGQGSLSSLRGTFEAARPGGSREQALQYFDRAIALSAGRSVGSFLAKAEGHALPAGDRRAFESLLQQALTVEDGPDSPLAMQNEVMRRRARWLLEKSDDLF